MCHAVRPMMLEGGGGAIVNFSSTYGNGINPENAINFVPVTYSTAKSAIRGFTTTLARDLAPEIRVNALAPGPISGEWETEWGVSPEHIEEAIAMNPHELRIQSQMRRKRQPGQAESKDSDGFLSPNEFKAR